jgi:hypothetical protein
MDPFTQIVVNIGLSAIIASLKTISETSSNIQTILRRFDATKTNRQILQALLESDIEATLQVIDELLHHVDISQIESKPLQLVIGHIQSAVEQIERELTVIHEKDIWNRQIWFFYYMRAYSFDQHISKIHILKRILDRRIDMLMKVIQISHEIQQSVQLRSQSRPRPDDWVNDV